MEQQQVKSTNDSEETKDYKVYKIAVYSGIIVALFTWIIIQCHSIYEKKVNNNNIETNQKLLTESLSEFLLKIDSLGQVKKYYEKIDDLDSKEISTLTEELNKKKTEYFGIIRELRKAEALGANVEILIKKRKQLKSEIEYEQEVLTRKIESLLNKPNGSSYKIIEKIEQSIEYYTNEIIAITNNLDYCDN